MLLLLSIFQIILVIILVSLVLIQNYSSDNILSLSSNQPAAFAVKNPANFITKLTWIVIVLFLINTLCLTLNQQSLQENKVIKELLKEEAPISAPFDD